MTLTDEQIERMRRWDAQRLGLHPNDVRALLVDRDRLHAIYKVADKVVMAEAGSSAREGALFELAAIVGAYEGETLP